jgi:putative ABC transport system permease protein
MVSTPARDEENRVPDAPISWSGLALSSILVVLVLALSWWRGLGLERSIVWACARGLVQLLAVGSALSLVLDDTAPIGLALAWVALMVVVAAFTVKQRAKEVPGIFPLALAATAASSSIGLGIAFGLHIFPSVGRAIVPVAGMIIGNSIIATVSASRRIVAELSEKRPEVEARLALGQSWREASLPYVRSALRVALTGQIESTKVVGLVSLPGTMTGLILAGVNPTDAVLVQAAIMFLILGAVAINATVVGIGLTHKLFTDDHRLVRLVRVTT